MIQKGKPRYDPALKRLLDQKVALYNQPSFIEKDPVSVPHRFTKLQDIEISGFFAALLAWGNVQRVLRGADFTARAAQQRREPSAAKIADLDG